MPQLIRLSRYPVKGLPPEDLAEAELDAGEAIGRDRAWALGDRAGPFDPDAPRHLSKAFFAQLMKQPRLARIAAAWRQDAQAVTLRADGAVLAAADLRDAGEREALAETVRAFLDLPGGWTLHGAPGLSLSDIPRPRLSLINLETVRAIEAAAGRPIDPVRFRGNLLIEGAPAWSEFDWLGREIRIGDIAFHAEARIGRCQATSVDLARGARDLDMVRLLASAFGHTDCGLYLETKNAGTIRPGASVGLV